MRETPASTIQANVPSPRVAPLRWRSWLVPSVVIGLAAATVPMAGLLGWVVLAIGGVVAVVLLATRHRLGPVVLVALAFRAGLALTHFYLFDLPDSRADARTFEARAWQLAQSGSGAFWDGIEAGWRLYVWLLAAMYRLTDRSPLMLQSVNVLFGTLTVVNVFHIARALWGEAAARRAALAAALFPTLALYSAITMREVAVVYTATLGVWAFVHWRRTARLRWLVPTLTAFLVTTIFHTAGAALLVGVGLLLAADAVGFARVTGWFRGTRALLGLATLGVLLLVMARTGLGLEKIQSLLVQGFALEVVMDLQQGRAQDRAAYLAGLPLDSPVDLLWQTPLRIFFFLFSPFAWRVRTPGDVIAFVDALLYAWLIWSIYRSRALVLADRARAGVLLLCIGLVTILALGTSNYGAALRHRAKAAPLLIALAAGSFVGFRRPAHSIAPSVSARPGDVHV